MTTIFELFDEAVRPVLDAVPKRASTDDLYAPAATDEDLRAGRWSDNPENLVAEAEQYNALAVALERMGLGKLGELNDTGHRVFSVMIRGPIRTVLTGVHEKAPSPLDIRGYADKKSGIVWNWLPDGSANIRGATLRQFPDAVADFLPEHPDAGRDALTVSIDTRADGVVSAEDEANVETLRAFFARERTGTVLVEMVAFQTLCAEYPKLGFALIDNDLGRFVLMLDGTGGPRNDNAWLTLHGYSADGFACWIEDNIEDSLADQASIFGDDEDDY